METDDRPMRQSDHDLLVTIHTKVERVIKDVQELNTNVQARIAVLEKTKAETSEIEDVRRDVKWLQKVAYGGISVLAAIQFYFEVIKK